MDILKLSLEYSNLYSIQIMFKAFLYSFKLKCEFYILDILTEAFHKRQNSKGEKKTGNMTGQVNQTQNESVI